jgi:hypothetical protein
MHRRTGPAAPMRHARHIDDDAELIFQHMRQHGLHGVERAVDIEREGLRQQRIVDIEKFGTADGARRIEQKLHRAESIDRALHHIVDCRARGDVGLDRKCLAAFAVDQRRRFVCAGFVDIGADHIGAFAGKDQCGGAAMGENVRKAPGWVSI